MSPSLSNPLVDQYRRYRTASKKLNSKILEAVMNETVLETAGRDLNFGKDKRLIFDNESEPDVLMDYVLYEIPQEGRTLIAHYTIERGGSNRIERDLLEAMLNAKTGLFRVEEVFASRYRLNLQEIIDGNRTKEMFGINRAYDSLLNSKNYYHLDNNLDHHVYWKNKWGFDAYRKQSRKQIQDNIKK